MTMDTHLRFTFYACLLGWCVNDVLGQGQCNEWQEGNRWLRPQEEASLVRDCGKEFQNNSIHDVNELFAPPNGLRCFSAIRDTQVAEWISPNGNIIINDDRSIGDFHINRMNSSGFIELIRNRGLNDKSGIFTCKISSRDGLQILHVGVYDSNSVRPLLRLSPEMEVKSVHGIATTVLNCSSSNSPATNVVWLRDDEVIEEDNYHQVNQVLRDPVRVVYDNLLMISDMVIESGQYKCVVNDSRTEECLTRRLDVVFPRFNNVSYNGTTQQLSWNTMKITPTVPNYVTPNITGCILLLNGGRCFKWTENVTLSQCDHVFLPNYDIDLENGANYTVQFRAMNKMSTSNSSMPYQFTTSSLVPDQPKPLNARAAGFSSILLSWEELECSKAHGVLTGYIIQQDNSRNHSVELSWSQNLTITDLSPFHEYSFKIAAINEAGIGEFTETTKARILTLWMIIVIGLSGGVLILLLCLVCICCCCIATKQRKRRRTLSFKRRRNQETSCLVGRGDCYEDGNEMVEVRYSYAGQEDISLEPVIEIFPDNMLACLGEYVIMYVGVHGNPPPMLTWYHNNQNTYNDSTIEISEDGTLSIPSMEARHVGDYRLVATNEHGSYESEMELHLESENTPNLSRALSMSLLIDAAPVPVSSLEEYVASHHSKSNDPFRCEFLSLNSENSGETTVGEMPQNRALNRFKHIVPYDDNRVILEPISGYDDCQHDYINASYIDGHNLQNAFIASQGPLPHTMIDFWRMVWQEQVTLIVMLCNTVEGHRVRCQQYWPSSGSQNYGPFRIKLETKHRFADYTLRTFEIKFAATTADSKLIEHYQFTSWPDNLLPENSSSLLAMHNKALSNLSLEGPILVHCSGGVGRTGAFIAMDRALEQAKEGVVDVMGIVNDMRQQRMKMVQTLVQYIDIYDSVLEHVVCGETKIDAVDLRVVLKTLRTVDQNTGQTTLEKQFQVLQKVTPSPLEVDRNVAAKNRDLNRSMEFLPRDTKRVVLYGGGGDYIHATFVDGYKHKKAFIVTQGPQVDTCNEFWKMIHQYDCGTIVMLSDLIEYNKEVCYPYWPKAGSEDYGDYNVEFMRESTDESLNMREFMVTCTSKENKNEKPHLVTQFHILNWMPDGNCSNLVTITRLLEEVTKNQIKTGNHPIVVHCSDTVGRSAIFAAALTAIEQCKTEVAIDIFHVVKGIRMQKPGAVMSAEQYSLIFDVVITYLDSIDNYANFN